MNEVTPLSSSYKFTVISIQYFDHLMEKKLCSQDNIALLYV